MPSLITRLRERRASGKLGRQITAWNSPHVRTLSRRDRIALAALVAEEVNRLHPHCKIESRIASEVETQGYSVVPSVLTSTRAEEARRYFETLPCLNRHLDVSRYGDEVRRPVDGAAREFPFGTWKSKEILRAPHLIEAITSPHVLDAVEAFLGARPMIFSVNCYWSFPQSGNSYGQNFHRDMSHPKFCVLFLYLTDTDEQSGAHVYARFTQSPEALAPHYDGDPREVFDLPMDGAGRDDFYESRLGHLFDTIKGPAGTGFLTDPYGLHRGLPPTAKPRLMAWARYSVFTEPPDVEKVGRRWIGNLPADERARYALRGIVR